jgi:hypothetical protein
VKAPSNTLLSRHLVIYAVDPDRVKKLLLASVVVSSRESYSSRSQASGSANITREAMTNAR